ncbi:hypothetical protein, partial [Streptomyces musisoli]|uniref:hypothetical protein n=1 Tax=Streptomyces musisoli TaxID=2802280 RepID=UPI001F15C56B
CGCVVAERAVPRAPCGALTPTGDLRDGLMAGAHRLGRRRTDASAGALWLSAQFPAPLAGRGLRGLLVR